MQERDRRLALFLALLRADTLDALVADPDARAQIAARLAPLRDRPGLDVASVAVNGERVDVVALDGDSEWRVVFGTTDAVRVDWLSVFERPPVVAAIEGGRAVIVNGPSSSGKSSVLAAIRSRSALPWVVFDEPMFGGVDIEYLIWRERAVALHRGFLDGIGALARAGNHVAVAAGGHPQSSFDAAFAGVTTIRVGLDCDPVELARRERGRADVAGGLATASLHVHDGWHYHLRFDTTVVASTDIADRALDALA